MTAPAARPARRLQRARLFWGALLLGGALRLAAAEPVGLGSGLSYVAIGAADSIPEQWPAAALVVDLRQASAGAERVTAALGELAATHPVVFVLVGADTPEALRTGLPSSPRLVVVAPAALGLPGASRVEVSTEDDRAAAAALAGGRPPAELVEEKLEKRRFDEARLAEVHANGGPRADEADPPATDASTAAGAPPAPLRDRLLQRAVFLHRALVALGRIPGGP